MSTDYDEQSKHAERARHIDQILDVLASGAEANVVITLAISVPEGAPRIRRQSVSTEAKNFLDHLNKPMPKASVPTIAFKRDVSGHKLPVGPYTPVPEGISRKRLTRRQVLDIRAMLADGATIRRIAEVSGRKPLALSRIRDGKVYTDWFDPKLPIAHPNAKTKNPKTGVVRRHNIGTILSPTKDTNSEDNNDG